jgi:hypothetical protein
MPEKQVMLLIGLLKKNVGKALPTIQVPKDCGFD